MNRSGYSRRMSRDREPPIALIGIMGAGKSAVARILGERLGTVVADLEPHAAAALAQQRARRGRLDDAAPARDHAGARVHRARQLVPLEPPELGLAAAREQLGDPAPGAGLDALVQVDRLAADARREQRSHGALPGAREADQSDRPGLGTRAHGRSLAQRRRRPVRRQARRGRRERIPAASIEAVMHPAKIDALYFVSRGDGTSVFSRKLEDHNRAVAKYQKSGRR